MRTYDGCPAIHPGLCPLGKSSYSLYVFHFPVAGTLLRAPWFTAERLTTMLGSEAAAQLAFVAVAGSISLVLAWLSWHLFEKHFLKLKDRFASVHAVPSAVSAPI